MKTPKRIVLDANILVRGVLGSRVLRLLETYSAIVVFYSPDVCFADASRHVLALAEQRNFSPMAGLETLGHIARIVQTVDRGSYEEFETMARGRIFSRDLDDWPILAASLLLDCPI